MAGAATTLPPTLKSLQHYMKIAGEHDKRNAVVAYYARMYVAQQGIKIDAKSPDARTFLIGKGFVVSIIVPGDCMHNFRRCTMRGRPPMNGPLRSF